MSESKIRKDSWSPSDDAVLAETVLRHVRNGSTQLKAFEEVSEALGRSSAACGFRWNSEVRKDYEVDLKAAKEIRKGKAPELPSESVTKSVETVENSDPFDALAIVLETTTKAYRQLQKDNDNLRREIVKLERQQAERPRGEDLENLMKLIESARKMGLLNQDSAS